MKLAFPALGGFLLVPFLCLVWQQNSFQQKSQQAPKESAASSERPQSRKNPVKPTPENLAEAKKFFGFDCSMCHGASGPKGSARPACPFAVARLQFITALSDASARASCREDALAQHWKCCGAT